MIPWVVAIPIFPLSLLARLIEVYLLLVAFRWLWSRSASPTATRIRLAVQRFTDYLPLRLHRLLANRFVRAPPMWVVWLAVISAVWLVRTLLLSLANWLTP